jgi:hypothetical protein
MNENELDLSQADTAEIEEQYYSFEQAASMTAVSVTLVQRLVTLNVIEAEDSQLHPRELARLAQGLRRRHDLGVNWVGAGLVLDLTQEISRLKARLKAYQGQSE